MKKLLTSLLYSLLLPVAFELPTARGDDSAVAPGASTARTIVITAGDSLRFDITKITAAPGERLRVQLHNLASTPKASMGHNWILLDSNQEMMPYATAAMTDKGDGYQPKAFAPHVLASISLLGPKEVGEVSFDAPTKPGTYPYFCSFPGHQMAGMRGELVVK